MVKMHIDPGKKSESFNCHKEIDSIINFSANIVLSFDGVIGGEFLSVSACCEICHELVQLTETLQVNSS